MEIKYIYHISNILIHAHKRYKEYDKIFDNLILEIKNENNGGVIVITGSLFLVGEALKILKVRN